MFSGIKSRGERCFPEIKTNIYVQIRETETLVTIRFMTSFVVFETLSTF